MTLLCGVPSRDWFVMCRVWARGVHDAPAARVRPGPDTEHQPTEGRAMHVACMLTPCQPGVTTLGLCSSS